MKKITKFAIYIMLMMFVCSSLFACDREQRNWGWITDAPPPLGAFEDDDYGWVELKDMEYGIPVFGDGLFSSFNMLYHFYANSEEEGNAILDEISEVLWEFNTVVSVGYSGGDVYRINEAEADTPVEVTFWTYDMINLSKEYYEKTDGYFNPATYPLLQLWNLRGLFISMGPIGFTPDTVPTLEQIEERMPYCTMDNLTTYKEGDKYYVKKSDARTQIELGAVAKGYGADLAKEIALERGIKSALFNISGNVVSINGKGKANDYWVLGLDEPVRDYNNPPNRSYFATYYLANLSSVTSGDYKLYYIYDYDDDKNTTDDTVRCAHILNPKTGMPVNVYYDEVTQRYKNTTDGLIMTNITGESSAISDILSTSTILMGMESSVDLMLELEGYTAILVSLDLRYTIVRNVYLYQYQGSNAYLTEGYKDRTFIIFE